MVEFRVSLMKLPAFTRYSVSVTSPSGGRVRTFSVPLMPVLAALVITLALPLLMGLGARWSGRAALLELETDNALLRMENASYREATDQFASQIHSLQEAVDEIGTHAGADPASSDAVDRLPAAVRSRAMGGATADLAEAMTAGTFGSVAATFGMFQDVLGALESRLSVVRSGVERRQALAAATPSIWPVAGWLSSGYGTRRDPFTGGQDFHPGLDIAASHGQPVQATADGTVVTAGFSGNYGNLIVLDHGFGLTTRYGHLSRMTVRDGQQVRRGDVVGLVGSTGRSTSPHLHYEVLVNGRLTNPLRLLTTRR